MEFIKNNLTILITGLVAIISGYFNVCQYIENKTLKKYSTEKKLKQRKADLVKLHKDYRNEIRMASFFGEREKAQNDLEHKKKYFESEIEYLKKILKIKNND